MKRQGRATTDRVIELAIIASAAVSVFAPLPPSLIDRYYSAGLYPHLQSSLTPVTNLLPFSLLDALAVGLLGGLVACWIFRLKRAESGRRGRAVGAMLLRTGAVIAGLVVAFQILWGLNYKRDPLAKKLDYDEQRIGAEAMRRLKRLAADRLNAEVARARGGLWPEDAVWQAHLLEAFGATLRDLGGPSDFAAAVPKTSLLNPYLQAAGVEAFINPFGYEVIVDSGLLHFEKPFLVAHEWAHLAGFSDEADASFVGLLACLRSDAAALNYSGWLALYGHTPWPPDSGEPPALVLEVIADLRAISDRARKNESEIISKTQARMYDRFLKANRVEAGIESYGLLVRLVLGTRFESEWVPARR